MTGAFPLRQPVGPPVLLRPIPTLILNLLKDDPPNGMKRSRLRIRENHSPSTSTTSSRITRRSTLPAALTGSSSRKSTMRGTL